MLALLLVTFFFALVVGTLVFSAWLLLLGARWVGAPSVTFRRSLAVTVAFNVIGVALNAFLSTNNSLDPFVGLFILLATLVVTWLIVQRGLRTTFGRAILAWLPTLLVPVTLLPIVAFIVRPYVLETYVIPSNGMAPTIVGEHYVSVCPKCGGKLIVRLAQAGRPPGAEVGICERCWQTSWVSVANQTAISGDRFVSIKFLRPRRWDLITFRYPEDPVALYVQRLVGLPGETIEIRKGEIWIDGRLAEKPAEIAALEYTEVPGEPGDPHWQQYGGPWTLGPDEYFTIGDFSRYSNDSRIWRQPLTSSHLDGVVTHTYWPPSRWRAFR